MLKILGVTATIADSPEQYIDIAIKLAEDREWRAHVVVQMQERRELLYDDRQCVSALEQFYQQAASRRS
jgi:predicted O-linked N-acetylglucosamine transferase (SPINDLY family)